MPKGDPRDGLLSTLTPIIDSYITWNIEKGYYCIKTNLSDKGMTCYLPNRGKHLEDINPQTKAILSD